MSLWMLRKLWRICMVGTLVASLAPLPGWAADDLQTGGPSGPLNRSPHSSWGQPLDTGRFAAPPVVAIPPGATAPRSLPAVPRMEPLSPGKPLAATQSSGAVQFSVTDPSMPAEPPMVRLHALPSNDAAPPAASSAPSAPPATDAAAATASDVAPAVSLEALKAAIQWVSFQDGHADGFGAVHAVASEELEEPAEEANPLQPIPDPQAGDPVEIEAASFSGITPGVSTFAEVQKAWGEPKGSANRGSLQVYLFSVGPFDKVEASFFQGRVTSIVVRLGKPFPADAVAKQLQLSAIRPVFVSNALGEILGQSFPERGVLLAFEPADAPGKPSMKVSQIILEPINAEPFVLRAETHLDTLMEASAKDLEVAVRLDPTNARAYWLQARVLFALEQHGAALNAATEAVRLESDNPQYRVTRAQVLGQLGQFDTAVEEAQRAVATSDKRPHIKAHALCLLGDLHGSGQQPDYKKAIAHHSEAMQLAEPLAQSPHPAIRLAAKEVLINAHLGAAHDIAWGNWNQKELAVTRWLERAAVIADDLVENEHANPEHRFRVAVRALAACVGTQGKLDPTPWAELMVKSAEGILTADATAAQKQRLQWDLAMALYDAVQIYQMRSDHDLALKFGQLAIDYLEQSTVQREQAEDYLLARLYFRMGAIHAVGKQDHKAAVAWFDKASPAFGRVANQIGPSEAGRLGETYVSMGVSYWETDQRSKAVELTEEGIGLIEQMVQKGAMESASLEIPYSNLATMHRMLGQNRQAEAILQKANKLKDTTLR